MMFGAITAGNQQEVRRLLREGADPNFMGDGRMTALMEASKRGNENIVRALLQAGADVNAEDSKFLHHNGSTALMVASKYGHVNVVRALLDRGANVNAQTWGWTALWCAINWKKTDVVRTLLEAGANITPHMLQYVKRSDDIPQNIRKLLQDTQKAKILRDALVDHDASTLSKRSETALSISKQLSSKPQHVDQARGGGGRGGQIEFSELPRSSSKKKIPQQQIKKKQVIRHTITPRITAVRILTERPYRSKNNHDS